GTNQIGQAISAPFSITWSNVTAGAYTLTAQAVDNYGAGTTSTAVNILVNQRPTIAITNPPDGAVFTAPTNVTISADAFDVDGTLHLVTFFEGTNQLGQFTAPPYAVTWSNVVAGNYTLTAQATDNHGATTISAAVNIVVDERPTIAITNPASGSIFI